MVIIHGIVKLKTFPFSCSAQSNWPARDLAATKKGTKQIRSQFLKLKCRRGHTKGDKTTKRQMYSWHKRSNLRWRTVHLYRLKPGRETLPGEGSSLNKHLTGSRCKMHFCVVCSSKVRVINIPEARLEGISRNHLLHAFNVRQAKYSWERMFNLFLKTSSKGQATDTCGESGKEMNSKHTTCLANGRVPQADLHVTCKVALWNQ